MLLVPTYTYMYVQMINMYTGQAYGALHPFFDKTYISLDPFTNDAC